MHDRGAGDSRKEVTFIEHLLVAQNFGVAVASEAISCGDLGIVS